MEDVSKNSFWRFYPVAAVFVITMGQKIYTLLASFLDNYFFGWQYFLKDSSH